MPLSLASLLPTRIRRDEVHARRQGTGRVTTKRTFCLNVFKGSQIGQFGRKTGLPLKQGVKRDAYGLDDVENFWRDSLEGAPSDQQAVADGESPTPSSQAAPPAVEAAPVPDPAAPPSARRADANPFQNKNLLRRTPARGTGPPMAIEEEEAAAASPLAPTQLQLSAAPAEEEVAPAEDEAEVMEVEEVEVAEVEAPATNPFKRRGAVMRTPKRPAAESLAPPSAADEEQEQDEATQPAAAEATQPAEVEATQPAERTTYSMGTSPIAPPDEAEAAEAAGPQLPDGRAVADLKVADLRAELEQRALSDKGTKRELAARLVAALAAGGRAPAAEVDVAAAFEAEDDAGVLSGEGSGAEDGEGGGSPARGLQEAERGAPTTGDFDGGDDMDDGFGGGSDDGEGDGMGGDENRDEDETPPPPPPPPPAAAPARRADGAGVAPQHQPTRGRKKARTAKGPKTSLERLGNTPWRARIAGAVEEAAEHLADGIRRGTRKRMKPLEYFRGERVVYGRRDSGRFPCPVDVITIPDEETPPHFRRMRARTAARDKERAAPAAKGGAGSSSSAWAALPAPATPSPLTPAGDS